MKYELEILTRIIEGEASSDEVKTFIRALELNPELRRQAAQLVEVHGLLGVALENESTSGAAAQTISNAIREAERENFVQNVHDKIVVMRRRTWTVPLAAAAAVALLALVVSPWNPLSSQPTLAQLKRVENLDWGDYPARELEANFAAGDSITFTEGLAELDLMGLGRMIIEGPASLDFPEPGHAVVHEGRVVVRVTPAGHGYRLDTPQGTIIDKGTEFGVLIAEDGHVETHVFDGEIEVVEDEGHTVTLTENDARRLDPKGGEVIPVDSGQFYSSLPPLRASRSKFIHWPLDDGNGRTASVNSNGLGNEDSNLTLLGALNSEPPGWVGGVFGGALNFNGKGSYTESSYRGIPDGEPRTVCCWVKAPVNFVPEEGYSIISWGHHAPSDPGAAWQISINPIERDGPIGRLRLGILEGQIVGLTDLRDGQWHHVAVVLYEGDNPNVGTHVLLYVDGRLEQISRRTLHEVRTNIDKSGHGVWMGRNMSLDPGKLRTPEQLERDKNFFRGSVDEVYIFDSALDRDAIVEIMEKNRPPAALGGTS